MRDIFVDKISDYIIKYNDVDEEVIRYGIEGLYIQITKSLVILFVAYLFNSLDSTLLFLLLFSLIRVPAFGIHLNSGSLCLVISTILFAILPKYISLIDINDNLYNLLFLFAFSNIILYAPSDTYKRPIYHRKTYKLFSIISSILLFFIHSSLALYAILLEVVFIHPFTYYLFKLPYANYERR